MARRGIVIANTGTPDAPEPEAVKRYLREFLSDPRIRPMNPLVWKVILNACILPRRSVASAQKYRLIWTPEGSPLAVTMASLAQKLEATFGPGRANGSVKGSDPAPAVRYAMSYGSPSLAAALSDLRQQGCEEVTVVPLYPQSAFSTTEAVLDAARRAFDALGWHPPVTEVRGYCTHPLYRAAIANCVRASGFNASAGDRLLFAFHSIPMADISAGDTYGDQAHATADAVARELSLAPDEWGIGFQCRFDRSRRWLRPFTAEVLKRLCGDGGRLFVVAPNFSVDCLETLYDIQIELRETHRAATAKIGGETAGPSLHYIPCLNDSAAHVHLLSTLLA